MFRTDYLYDLKGMSSQSQAPLPSDTISPYADRLPDREREQPSLRRRVSRPMSGGAYRRPPALRLSSSDGTDSANPQVQPPFQPSPFSADGSPPRAMLSPIAGALRQGRGLHVSFDSPRPIKPKILSPAHSARNCDPIAARTPVQVPEFSRFSLDKVLPTVLSPVSPCLTLKAPSFIIREKAIQKALAPTHDDEPARQLTSTSLTASSHLSIPTAVISRQSTSATGEAENTASATPHGSIVTSKTSARSSGNNVNLLPTKSQSSTTLVPNSRGSLASYESVALTTIQDCSSPGTQVARGEECRAHLKLKMLSDACAGSSSSRRNALSTRDTFSHDNNIALTIDDKQIPNTRCEMHVKGKGNGGEATQRGRNDKKEGCRVRKKAVIIAISYIDNSSQGTTIEYGQAARKWYDILVRRLEFISDEVRLVTDMPPATCGNALCLPPTYSYILASMEWLTDGAAPGDKLFFAFSGDVGHHGPIDDVCNPPMHFAVPGDFPSGSVMWDEEFDNMVRRVPVGVDMHLVFDCRRSWSVVRLPYIYLPFKPDRRGQVDIHAAFTPDSWGLPEIAKRASRTLKNFTRSGQQKENMELERQKKFQQKQIMKYKDFGNVVSFGASPAKYRGFSFKMFGVSPLETGEYCDAFIMSIEKILRQGQPLTYANLMLEIAQVVSPPGKMCQMPQVSATHDLDLNTIIPF